MGVGFGDLLFPWGLTLLLIESLVNLSGFGHPLLTFAMGQIHQIAVAPMHVIGKIGYLLVEPIDRVA
jgi:hypothetical protein